MNEIICPQFAKAFKVDEAGYADILNQLHDKEFDKKLHERLLTAGICFKWFWGWLKQFVSTNYAEPERSSISGYFYADPLSYLLRKLKKC